MTASKSKKKRYVLKSKGRTVMFVARSSSGVVAGVPGAWHPKKPHYTAARIGKQIDRHIKFDSGGGGIPLGPMSQEEVREVVRFVSEYMVPWDPNLEYWVPTQKSLDSWDVEGPLPPESKWAEPVRIPDQMVHPKLDDPSLWTRARLGDPSMSKTGWGIVYRNESPVVIIFAIGRLCEMTLEEATSGPRSRFIEALGFDRLLDLLRRTP